MASDFEFKVGESSKKEPHLNVGQTVVWVGGCAHTVGSTHTVTSIYQSEKDGRWYVRLDNNMFGHYPGRVKAFKGESYQPEPIKEE